MKLIARLYKIIFNAAWKCLVGFPKKASAWLMKVIICYTNTSFYYSFENRKTNQLLYLKNSQLVPVTIFFHYFPVICIWFCSVLRCNIILLRKQLIFLVVLNTRCLFKSKTQLHNTSMWISLRFYNNSGGEKIVNLA